MDLGLRGRTAIVGGASSGIGLAVAEALSAEGANVAMFARRRELLEREAERIGALAVDGDLTVAEDLARLVAQTADAFGQIDILVNNGGGPAAGAATATTTAGVESAVNLLLRPMIGLTQLCLPYLEQSSHGRIINIESVSVLAPFDDLALSNTIRPAVVGWMKTLAREIAQRQITVNTIAPGKIDTEALKSVYGNSPAIEDIPARRLGHPGEVAAAVCFLASDCAAYVTGAVIPVDGGLICGRPS